MKYKSLVFPNPNQIIILKNLQNEIFSKAASDFSLQVHFPIYLECKDLTSIQDKVSKIQVNELKAEEKEIFLSVSMTVNSNERQGKIKLFTLPENKNNALDDILKNIPLKIERISPFRLVKIKIEEEEKACRWKILEEKWGK